MTSKVKHLHSEAHFDRIRRFLTNSDHSGSKSHGIISHDIISHDIRSYDIISYDIIWYHMIRYHMISYHMISYDMIWSHIIWYHMILYDMLWWDKIHVLDMFRTCSKKMEGRKLNFSKKFRRPLGYVLAPSLVSKSRSKIQKSWQASKK